MTSFNMWECMQYNLGLNKHGLTACHWLACPYNLDVLIGHQKANQACVSFFFICSFHSSFPSSSDHCSPFELYQQLTAFQPISKGKHNNSRSLGLMHSTSSAVNTNWFLKVLSFRRALLALVFVKKRGPLFEIAGHTKNTTYSRGRQRPKGVEQWLMGSDKGRLQLTSYFISLRGLCLIVQQGRVVTQATGTGQCHSTDVKERAETL